MKTITLTHLYACAPLYDLLYNTTNVFKMAEATGFGRIMESIRPKSILELFAGAKSYHKDQLRANYYYADEVKSYTSLDAYADPAPGVINADTATGDYGQKFDAALAYFRSGGCVIDLNDPTGRVNRAYAVKLFANVYKHLNPGGVLIMDFAANGYREALEVVTKAEIGVYEANVTVNLGTAMRDYLVSKGIRVADKDLVTLKTTYTCEYDRQSGNMVDTIQNCVIFVNGAQSLSFKVKSPLTQRLFGEPELKDILADAGFDSFDFWYMDYLEGSFSPLTNTLTGATPREVGWKDELSSAMANVIVSHKRK